MKKTMLAAALAALAIGSASAETIYVTGSTAFRAAANYSINKQVTNGNSGGVLLASDKGIADITKLGGAGNVVWKTAANDYIVACWNGSEAGIQSVAGPTAPVYAPVITTNPAVTNTFTGVTNPVGWTNGTITHTGTGAAAAWKQVIASYKTTNNGTQLQAPNKITFWGTDASGTNKGTTVSSVAHIAFADTYQSSSAFGSGSKIAYYATNAIAGGVINTNAGTIYTNSYVALSNDTIVGGVGFAFIVSPNYAYASGINTNFANGNTPVIANITPALAKKLYTNGVINAAELSGGLDTNVTAYAIGRNIDSGTRVQAMACIGLSSLIKSNGVNAGIQQYLVLAPGAAQKYPDGTVYASNSSTTTLLLTNWNADLVNGKLCTNGDSGYSSGGTLATVVGSATNLPANSVLIGYAGINDAVGNNAPLLSYNGVFPSVSAIKSGNYPFWGYEHLMVAPTASPTAVSFASNVATEIKTFTDSELLGYAKGIVSYSTLTNTVSRAVKVDGGAVSKLWSTNGLPNW